jgi:hypothetical protein
MSRHRTLAGLLAVGGTIWGMFCLPLLWEWDEPLKPLILGPGYLVTVGYFIRCLSNPSLAWCRVIWGASGFVQGAWLISFFLPREAGFLQAWRFFGHGNGIGFLILGGWWTFAFIASVYGLTTEPGISKAATIQKGEI